MSPNPGYSLDELVDVGRADVYKQGALAGHIERDGDDVVFRYDDGWIDHEAAPIATTLPLTGTPHRTAGGAVPAFFAGLLPEGRRLTALWRATKTSPDDADASSRRRKRRRRRCPGGPRGDHARRGHSRFGGRSCSWLG
ncbi:HipA N-terminal domain-containing protein [Phytoactinopolyspora limicola]|uniref:HipA N-terminal domain-containing protein n=1 Tax=Phytoactinopolyspora limicola TaxID=2715536 RepID=UPI00140A05C4